MKLAHATSEAQPPPAPPPAATTPVDILAESQNDEFMVFREDSGKTWAFPRAHLVESKTEGKVACEFNFRTHLVTFGGDDCSEIHRSLRKGLVCAVVAGKWPTPPDHVRVVSTLKVEANDDHLKKGNK